MAIAKLVQATSVMIGAHVHAAVSLLSCQSPFKAYSIIVAQVEGRSLRDEMLGHTHDTIRCL